MERDLRKARSDLALCGGGAILFGLWIFVKAVLYNLFAEGYLSRVLHYDSIEPPVKTVVAVLWISVSFCTMAVHLYIGRCAIREGRDGKKQKRRYLMLAAICLVWNGFSAAQELFAAGVDWDIFTLASDLLLGTAMTVNFGLVLYSAFRVRKLTKAKEAAACAD